MQSSVWAVPAFSFFFCLISAFLNYLLKNIITYVLINVSDLEVVNGSPAEIPRMRENVMREGRHLCFQLQNPSGIAATAVRYVLRTNHLVVGFANGYVQLWNLKTLKQE